MNSKPVSLLDLVKYFARLGALGFGGPIALAGYMQRDLVPRGWMTQDEYAQGLAFAQTMPGPLAAQLAMWVGFIRYGVLGASLVGIVFILPAYLIVVLVAILYVAFNGLSIVQALFYGIGATIIAIIARSAYKLALTTVGRDWRLWAIFALVAIVTIFTRTEIAVLFILAGIVGVFLYARPRVDNVVNLFTLTTFGAPAITLPLFLQLGTFFVIAGAFTFGSGLAIVPFLHQGVVVENHWLTEREFLDAVAVGIITPGPVVITAAFVGYLVGGFWGSLIAAAGVFLPVYLFVLFIGRYIIRQREHPMLKGFVKGATAAASGAIAGAAVILAQGSVTDVTTALIGIASLLSLWRFKIPEPLLIAAAGIAGVILYRGG